MESTCATTQEAAFYDGVLAYPLKVTGILQTDAYIDVPPTEQIISSS